jgi:hypothetical protein
MVSLSAPAHKKPRVARALLEAITRGGKKIDEIYGHRPEDGCESVIRTYEQIDEDIGEVTCSHG